MKYISFSDYMDMDYIKLLNEKELGIYKHKSGAYITILEHEMEGQKQGYLDTYYQFKMLTVLYYWDEQSYLNNNYDKIPEFGNTTNGKELRSCKKYITYNNKTWERI